jgi:hypothetical protein
VTAQVSEELTGEEVLSTSLSPGNREGTLPDSRRPRDDHDPAGARPVYRRELSLPAAKVDRRRKLAGRRNGSVAVVHVDPAVHITRLNGGPEYTALYLVAGTLAPARHHPVVAPLRGRAPAHRHLHLGK